MRISETANSSSSSSFTISPASSAHSSGAGGSSPPPPDAPARAVVVAVVVVRDAGRHRGEVTVKAEAAGRKLEPTDSRATPAAPQAPMVQVSLVHEEARATQHAHTDVKYSYLGSVSTAAFTAPGCTPDATMARLSRARLSTALLLLLVACPFAAVSPPPPSESDGAKFVYIREGDLTEEQLRLSRAMSPGEVARARAIDETIGIRNLALDHDATLLVEGKLAVTRGRHGLSVSSLDDHWVGWCLRLIGEWEEVRAAVATSWLAAAVRLAGGGSNSHASSH